MERGRGEVTDEDKQWLQEMEDRLIETIRDAQTEILRGFEAHATAMTLRFEIEKRLGGL